MPLDSLMSLCLPAPFPFFLCFYESPTIAVLSDVFSTESIYVFVKSLVVHLILLESRNILVQLLLSFRVSDLIIDVRIGEVGCMELKVGRVVDQEFFRRSRFFVARFSNHTIPSFCDSIGVNPCLL